MGDFFIHIGYPKTASTTLQNKYFPQLSDVLYLGQPFSSKLLNKVIEVDLLEKDEIEYNKKTVIKLVGEELSQIKKGAGNKPILLSYEGLCFSWQNKFDRSIVAKRLFDIFGTAKIIIVIRDQFSLIQSLYKQSVLGGNYTSFQKFLELFWDNYYHSFYPQIKYYELIKTYADIFGKTNIKVFCYEELIESVDAFLESLSRFLGVEPLKLSLSRENKGLSRQALFVKRILNRLITYDFGRPSYMPGLRKAGYPENLKGNFRLLYKVCTNKLARKIDSICGFKNYQPVFSEEWKQRITKLYAESNTRLSEEFDLPLKKYSYPIM